MVEHAATQGHARWMHECHELRHRMCRLLPREATYEERRQMWLSMSCPCDWCQHPHVRRA